MGRGASKKDINALNSSGNTLTIFCVNRHLTDDMTASISVRGFGPASQATAQSLYADSIYEENSEINPEAVHPQMSTAKPSGPNLNFKFRHESVRVLTLNKAQ